MADRINWITHRDHRILRIDYSGLQGQEFLSVIAKVPTFYRGQPKGSVLCFIDVRGSCGSQEVVNAMKKMVKDTTKEIDRKVAILGITGIKKAILITINMFTGHTMKAFEGEEEALDWLAA